jgi:very-short-patch-repair endonuclease
MASRAHGVVTRAELLCAGITAKEVRQRLETGALIAVFPGVYRVGHTAPSSEAHYLAAAHLWGLLKGPAPAPEVTAPTERRVKGVETHRARRAKRETTTWRGIAVTTPARTLVDLAAVSDETQLARACHEAGVRHRTTPKQVEAVLARCPNAPGAGRLGAVLRGDVHVTLSKLESRFLDCLRAAGLPLPVTNRPAGGRRVDCRWSEQRLTVELDSYRYHHTRHAWEQDRRREREAFARGDEFRRYTYADVTEDPRLMLRELRALLAP